MLAFDEGKKQIDLQLKSITIGLTRSRIYYIDQQVVDFKNTAFGDIR